jgi:hypothetical protein
VAPSRVDRHRGSSGRRHKAFSLNHVARGEAPAPLEVTNRAPSAPLMPKSTSRRRDLAPT